MILRTRRLGLAAAAITALCAFEAQGAESSPRALDGPATVSPGATRSIAESSSSCPTFLWSGVRGLSAYELRVYRGARGQQLIVEHDPVIEAEVAGGATGWTSPGASCLEPGLYSWLVRGRRTDGDAEESGVWTGWSEAAWFEVPARPSDDDVSRALEILERRLGTDVGQETAGSRRGLHSRSGGESGAPGSSSPSELREPAAGGTGPSLRADGRAVLDSVEIGGELTVSGPTTISSTATLDEALLYTVVSQFLTVTDTLELNDLKYTGDDRIEPGGGSGYFSVGSATFLDVDSNTHKCANGGLVRGLRLIEQPTNQLAFELICTN